MQPCNYVEMRQKPHIHDQEITTPLIYPFGNDSFQPDKQLENHKWGSLNIFFFKINFKSRENYAVTQGRKGAMVLKCTKCILSCPSKWTHRSHVHTADI